MIDGGVKGSDISKVILVQIDHKTTNVPHSLYHLGIVVLISLLFSGFLYILAKFGSRLLKPTKNDLKNSGLNHNERRKWRAIERRKARGRSRIKKKTYPRF